MTTDVRVKVKNYKGVETAMQNEVLFVVGRIRSGVTKDTGIGPGHISSAGCDVGVSPGTPESFHEKILRKDPRRAQLISVKEVRAAAC